MRLHISKRGMCGDMLEHHMIRKRLRFGHRLAIIPKNQIVSQRTEACAIATPRCPDKRIVIGSACKDATGCDSIEWRRLVDSTPKGKIGPHIRGHATPSGTRFL